MDLTKQVKLSTGKEEWPVWKHTIRDLVDYNERALEVGKLQKPEPLSTTAEDTEIKKHKVLSDFYRKLIVM